MNPRLPKKPRNRGFALIVTLSLMILLTVIAVGLLSLSAISLRTSASGEAEARAYANARMAVVMAIGELQKEAGDDRRITADASISPKASQPHLVGTWSSWSPELAAKPDQGGPDYDKQQTDRFRSWMVSAPDPKALKKRDWAEAAVDPKSPRLFSVLRDGFNLNAAAVPAPRGGIAWAVSQENTKAKINVAGPETEVAVNVALQAQRRPSLALAATLKQPKDGWNTRAGRVLSLNQVVLDPALSATSTPAAGASYTVHAQGLLTDAVKGGLKTDLNLGFELSDENFAKSSLGNVPNPFRSANSNAGFASPASYQGQRALFLPLVENPIVPITTDYFPATVDHRFFAAGVPTFDHLRSFYRIPHHLYGDALPTVAERGADHVAIDVQKAGGGSLAPSNPPPGDESTTSIRPVLNRMVYLLSATLGANDQVHIALTPVISLWNPYNSVLEIEGAVAYPWMDLPFQLNWEFKRVSGDPGQPKVNMSMMMGKQFEADFHGRSVNPYFLCELTANGDSDVGKPIRFEPGEVRVFVPASQTPVLFNRLGSNEQRTVKMRPVDEIGQMNTKGGLLVPMSNGVKTNGIPHGFTYKVKPTDKVSLVIEPTEQGRFHYFVTLEDAARIKNKSDSTRGQAISEVQMLGFASAVAQVASPVWSYAELQNAPQQFAVIETFHRTAQQSVGGQPIADLIYTTNPRHASINHQLASGNFTVAPHFQSTLRSASTFDGAVETSIDGRRSFWGPSHSAFTGKTHLPFFETPREPLLSLAAFQHVDLAASTFSPANQFANSWASPYLARDKTAKIETKHAPSGVPIYDTSYLTNEALWDGFFFSGAAPVLQPASSGQPASAWKNPIARVQRDLEQVITEFVADPLEAPLANSRMRLDKGGLDDATLIQNLLDPAGCTRIAAHLTVDGAFNINSTDVEAWTAQLSSLRGETFQVQGGTAPNSGTAAFPRFRHPTGKADDNWNGFRTLTDAQVRTLAENLVTEIRARGPFLSLAEFVNRRVEDSELGLNGAIQAAINAGQLNKTSEQATFSTAQYPKDGQPNIIPDTGVGIPGYLTQADVLQSLAPVITCRSDTFTIRGYGEAKDASGKVIARSWCEAVVQRTPEFVDPSDRPDTALASVTPVNQIFGRRFELISFRRVPSAEIQ